MLLGDNMRNDMYCWATAKGENTLPWRGPACRDSADLWH